MRYDRLLNYKKWPSDSSKGSGTPDFLAILLCKVCDSLQAWPARYDLSMVRLRSCYMLDTDVIEEMVNVSIVDDIQLTLIQILDQNSNIFI